METIFTCSSRDRNQALELDLEGCDGQDAERQVLRRAGSYLVHNTQRGKRTQTFNKHLLGGKVESCISHECSN